VGAREALSVLESLDVTGSSPNCLAATERR
jgi:hypothetical protein